MDTTTNDAGRFLGFDPPVEDLYHHNRLSGGDDIQDVIHGVKVDEAGFLYPLVKEDDPNFHTVLEDFDFQNPPCDPLKLSLDLFTTMRYNKGAGIAANQVGLPYRMFLMYGDPVLPIFNPEIVAVSDATCKMEEGCLTFPKLFLNIERPRAVKVKFQSAKGIWSTRTFYGMSGRIFLHEFDHLNGIDFTTKVNRIHLDRARNKARLAKRREKHKR